MSNTTTILAVDDEVGVLYSIKNGLESVSDYKIITVSSGFECFELLNKGEKPDLIILDINMPEMNGWEIFDKLSEKKNWQEIPLIFLTAKSDFDSKKKGNLIAYDFIEKPFEITDLKKRIDKIIQ